MTTSTVFTNHRSQAIRLPAQARFLPAVKKVQVRVVGSERVISPVDQVWDSFFVPSPGAPTATDDFMAERAPQDQPARESF